MRGGLARYLPTMPLIQFIFPKGRPEGIRHRSRAPPLEATGRRQDAPIFPHAPGPRAPTRRPASLRPGRRSTDGAARSRPSCTTASTDRGSACAGTGGSTTHRHRFPDAQERRAPTLASRTALGETSIGRGERRAAGLGLSGSAKEERAGLLAHDLGRGPGGADGPDRRRLPNGPPAPPAAAALNRRPDGAWQTHRPPGDGRRSPSLQCRRRAEPSGLGERSAWAGKIRSIKAAPVQPTVEAVMPAAMVATIAPGAGIQETSRRRIATAAKKKSAPTRAARNPATRPTAANLTRGARRSAHAGVPRARSTTTSRKRASRIAAVAAATTGRTTAGARAATVESAPSRGPAKATNAASAVRKNPSDSGRAQTVPMSPCGAPSKTPGAAIGVKFVPADHQSSISRRFATTTSTSHPRTFNVSAAPTEPELLRQARIEGDLGRVLLVPAPPASRYQAAGAPSPQCRGTPRLGPPGAAPAARRRPAGADPSRHLRPPPSRRRRRPVEPLSAASAPAARGGPARLGRTDEPPHRGR
jgi:hypothetical protein